MSDKSLMIEGVFKKDAGQDIMFQFEKMLFLLEKPDLMGILLALMGLHQIGYVQYKTQKHLAKRIGLSEPTFIAKRKQLEAMGLIKIIINSNKMVMDLKFLSRLKFFKLPLDASKQSDYIDSAVKTLIPMDEKEGLLKENSTIYNIYSTNNINNTNNIVQKSKTFPKQDYDIVLTAYKKYKGVGLVGPEVAYHMKAIKLMFQADRKPKEIVDFMKWLHDNEKNEETGWVKTWTIWTVQKKLPEFVAGKLNTKTVTDTYPRL